MKKPVKILIVLVAVALNVLFFHLCGYWQQMQYLEVSYIDLFFGIIAVIVLALGETSIIIQIYYRYKFRALQKRAFDKRFWLQCFLIVFFYCASVYFSTVLIYSYSIFYIAILAFLSSIGWMKGSRVLWSGETESYYQNERCKLYTVSNVMENDEVFELACSASGERDRTITIAKKKNVKF